jgi:hypothetical protein
MALLKFSVELYKHKVVRIPNLCSGISMFKYLVGEPFLGSVLPPIQCLSGALFPGNKRSRRKADNSPPLSGKVTNACGYTTTAPHAFTA